MSDEYWKDGVFTSFAVVELKTIEEAFAERVLAQLHKQELITDDEKGRSACVAKFLVT